MQQKQADDADFMDLLQMPHPDDDDIDEVDEELPKESSVQIPEPSCQPVANEILIDALDDIMDAQMDAVADEEMKDDSDEVGRKPETLNRYESNIGFGLNATQNQNDLR